MEVQFDHVNEIRMGSPFNLCTVMLKGDWIPPLQYDEFQDLMCSNKENNIIGLVRWEIDDSNEPGFRIVMIDESRKTVKHSSKIEGCCESLAWNNGKVIWQSTTGQSGTVTPE